MVESNSSGLAAKGIGAGLIILLVLVIGVGIYWSEEPNIWDVRSALAEQSFDSNGKVIVGAATTQTLIELTEKLLNKPGGYITNDIMPPGLFMDNMPNWEFGVLVQVRDMSRALRKDIARSQSTSAEDRDLAKAEPQLHFNSDKFWLPSTEGEYKTALKYLERYRQRLVDANNPQAQFFARADNLRNWLADVETRLGSMSQRLSTSVGKHQLNIDLAGDSAAQRATVVPSEQMVKTPFFEIDDVFYEARGSAFALVHLLKAIEIDFHDVLKKKNALVSVQQIIRELEATQEPLGSPIILNGGGFGMLANHSLVMANYISRANAAIIDLRELLSQG
ncbi:hypothetical protein A9Q99_15745 [Gammaproteobacteria bacterium 45_16_T64]|nr:hypothetical protein A9Q99_15745 [Gammaproteobacteria bacterium 45_16_T64]